MKKAGGLTVGPGDHQGIYGGELAQADDLFVIDGGLEASAGNDLAVEDLAVLIDADFGADGEGIGVVAVEEGADVVVVVELAGVVAIDKGGPVLVIDDQVEIAIAIEVAVGGAVGKGGVGESPGEADVLEPEVAQVAEAFAQEGGLRDPG